MSQILLTGDFTSTSAQGVRYISLFGMESSLAKCIMISYTPYIGSLSEWWQHICASQYSGILYKVLNQIQRRVVFPDQYLFRLYKYVALLRTLLYEGSGQAIVIGCTPFSLLLLGPWLKKTNPSVFIYADLSDPFSFNMENYNRPIQRVIAQDIERRCLPSFDSIVVLNECIKSKYGELYPEMAHKFYVIEQGVDCDFIDDVHKSITDKKTKTWSFLYAGGFYKHGRNPRHLYDAFNSSPRGLKLEIYGNLWMSMRPSCSTKITFHKAVAKQELVKVTAQADALILFDNEYGYQVPGKTLETLAINKPVLFIYNNEKSPTLDYVREATGVVWAKNNVEDISRGIERIVSGDFEPRSFDYSPYTWEKMREKYQLLLGDEL